MESTIGIKFTTEDNNESDTQTLVAKHFVMLLKENIQNQFNSHDTVSSFSAYYLEKNAKTFKI